MKSAEELADEHWRWIEGLFESLPDDTQFGISTTEYLYKTAFIHGFKHASNKPVELTTSSEPFIQRCKDCDCIPCHCD